MALDIHKSKAGFFGFIPKISPLYRFGTETTGTYYVDNIAGGADGVAIPDSDGDTVIDTVDACPNDAGAADTNVYQLYVQMTLKELETSLGILQQWCK